MTKVKRKELNKALSKMKKCVVTGSEMSPLSKVWLRDSTIVATDMRKQVIVPVDDLGLNVCVNYKEFATLVNKTRHEEMEIEDDGEQVLVKTGEYEAGFVRFDEKQYPNVKEPDLNDFEPLPGNFRIALAHCMDFTSDDMTRYVMTGIYVNEKDMVATDGRRIGKYEMDKDMPELIISGDIADVFQDMELDSYWIDKDRNWVWFSGADGLLGGAYIDGKFPDYQRVMNDENPVSEFVLDREILSGSEIVKLFQDKELGSGNGGRVFVAIKDDEFTLRSKSDMGKILYRHQMEEGTAGEDVTFAVNYQFLLEAMKEDQMDVTIYDAGLGKKIYLSAGNYTAVVMGMEEE